MSEALDLDLLVVGGGQCGVPLVHAMARAGWRVALAERRQLGGSCINFGCTPTKAVLASARLAHDARRAAELGVRIPSVEVDFAAVLERARSIAAESRTGIEKRFEKSDNPRLLRGHARFIGKKPQGFALRVGDRAVHATQVVLDTGTRTRVPSLPGLETVDFLHAGNWLDRNERPAHVAMLGGGVIALEMAQFYSRVGSRVSLIARAARIAGREDEDVATALTEALKAEGIEIRTETAVDSVRSTGRGVQVSMARAGKRETLEASHLFVALGRQPNTDDLGLETIGLGTLPDGTLAVDERLATSVLGVWAAGDIRGGPMFTHSSWDDYRILKSQLLGPGDRTTRRIVPYAIFTDPELGRVGLTEAEARSGAREVQVMRFDMAKNGRAREMGAARGFIKVVVDSKTREILGAAVLGEAAGELVHLYVDIMNAGAPSTVIRDAVHIHPTLAEAVQSAVTP